MVDRLGPNGTVAPHICGSPGQASSARLGHLRADFRAGPRRTYTVPTGPHGPEFACPGRTGGRIGLREQPVPQGHQDDPPTGGP